MKINSSSLDAWGYLMRLHILTELQKFDPDVLGESVNDYEPQAEVFVETQEKPPKGRKGGAGKRNTPYTPIMMSDPILGLGISRLNEALNIALDKRLGIVVQDVKNITDSDGLLLTYVWGETRDELISFYISEGLHLIWCYDGLIYSSLTLWWDFRRDLATIAKSKSRDQYVQANPRFLVGDRSVVLEQGNWLLGPIANPHLSEPKDNWLKKFFRTILHPIFRILTFPIRNKLGVQAALMYSKP